jgi:uncharacterized membrane protein YjjP (DUF1212 family)
VAQFGETVNPPQAAAFRARSQFVCALAKQLHEAGTNAGRLENALRNVSGKLGLEVAVWSSPTAVILGFTDAQNAELQQTHVLRLQPGDVDLRAMCAMDDIAERVTRGELDFESGARALVLAGAPVRPARLILETYSGFVMANIGVACLLKLAWLEIAIAGVIGAVLASMYLSLGKYRRFMQGMDALCAIVAAFLVTLATHYAPINYRPTLLASLIVLLPGLSITSAAAEIATHHLVSGTARMAGAFATLLKLSFGSLVGAGLAKALVIAPGSGSLAFDITRTLPATAPWVPWFGLAVSATSFAILFKALPRDFPLAIGAAILGYACTRIGGDQFGKEFGVFFAGLVVTLVANSYARIFKRPGALIRLPGIILLVPGSVGLKSLAFVLEKNVDLGLETAVQLLLVVVSLVAGILFAGTLVAPRHSL